LALDAGVPMTLLLEPTARNSGKVSCHLCGHLTSSSNMAEGGTEYCDLCNHKISSRKAYSLQRSCALLIAAIVFYVPANVYPIMTIISFGKEYTDTILSGVVTLIEIGQTPIAVVIFVASVFIPLTKILILGFLIISIFFRMTRFSKTRTILYHAIEFVGRWSMIDIFVISILVGLVQLQAIATIKVGPGALSFAVVVILTMLATKAFDSRLIWDASEEKSGGRAENG
jgi:paraquat-inducible protein A